jgi:hypothetical protein
MCGVRSESENRLAKIDGITTLDRVTHLATSPNEDDRSTRMLPESMQHVPETLAVYVNRILEHPAVVLAPKFRQG